MFKEVNVFGTDQCNYCEKAKKTLTDADITFEYINVEKDEKALAFVREVWAVKGKPATVPLICIDGRVVGGYTELEDLLNDFHKSEKNDGLST
jgi:glutaredoxin